jgi:hypothetical protein
VNVSRKRSDFGLRSINSAMLRRRSISRHHPGNYETVRRVLGHRDIQTTIRFYCGLETMQATEEFGKLIRKQIKFEPQPEE